MPTCFNASMRLASPPRRTLVSAAWAAARVKGSYLESQFLRLKARRGAKKAILAAAASMLTATYHVLKNGVEYRDLGADHFTRCDRSKAVLRPDGSATWVATS